MSDEMDELVKIDNLYAFINIGKYRAYLSRNVADPDVPFTEAEMPLRVNTIYPASNVDSAWISVYFGSGALTSFPVDLVERFTNIPPKQQTSGV